jgi:hypothetical protein
MARIILPILLLAVAGVESAVLRPRQAGLSPYVNGPPMCIGPGGKVADPFGALPKKVVMKSAGTPGTQRVKIRPVPILSLHLILDTNIS